MAKDKITEIAWRQRFLSLLQKVNSGKTLSKSELAEVKKYERQSAKSKKPMTDTIIPKKSKSEKRKTVKKKTGRKRRSISPITEAEVKLLGLECDSLTEADATLKITKSLSEIFKEHPAIKAAWDRGRLLRNLRDFARTGSSITAAAKKLKFESGTQLRKVIKADAELDDVWEQTILELHFEIRSAVIEQAKEGNAAALKAVDGFLSQEKERGGLDASHITIQQLAELTGKHRKTIHDWISRCGLPRNPDRTFDLSVFLSWYEDYLLRRSKSSAADNFISSGDPLRTMRAEKLKVEIARHRNQLLDRDEVIMGQIAWVQNIITFCKRGVEELAKLCSGQPREKIIEILKRFFSDLHSESAKVPNELKLPAEKEKQLEGFLLSLRPRGQRNDTK